MVEPLDPSDPEFIRDPFPYFRKLREVEPIHFSAHVGGWVFTAFRDVVSALKDSRLSSDRITPYAERLEQSFRCEVQQLTDSLGRWAIFADPPRHSRIRSLFNRAFTSHAVDNLQPLIEEWVDELLEAGLQRGQMEFIEDLAYPLPARVIFHMLGMPLADLPRIRRWSADIEPFLGMAQKPREVYRAALRSNHALCQYFGDLIAERRQSPRDDLLSRLIAAQEDGQFLSDAELESTAIMLLFAAHATTTHFFGNAMLALLKNPDQFQLLRENPELGGTAAEEFLRYDGPIQTVRRIAREDFEVRGSRIRAGELVFLMLNAANRDPDEFSDPDRLDLRRRGARHLGFGHGIHFCSGAPLVRLEAQVFFSALVRRTSSVQLASKDLSFTGSFGFRGLAKLPISLRR